jgi:hypothetical protein
MLIVVKSVNGNRKSLNAVKAIMAIAITLTFLMPTIIGISTEGMENKVNSNNPPIEWIKIYDGGDEDVAQGVAVDSNNNVIVTGYSTISSSLYFYTIKYDKDGNELGHAKYNTGGYGGSAMAVAVDSNDNIIVAGAKYRLLHLCDYCIVKYDENLNRIWTRTYSYHGRILNVLMDIAIDSSDNVIVTGMTDIWIKLPSSEYKYKCDYWTLKLRGSGGRKIWDKIYDGGDIDSAFGVAVDSEDNIIVTGASSNDLTSNYCTIKYDKDGNVKWAKTDIGGIASGVVIDSRDNIIITGISEGNYCTIKYDSNGNRLWKKIYDSGGDDDARAVAVNSRDCIIVTGVSKDDYYTIGYDSDGEEMRNATYDGGFDDESHGVAVDFADNVIVTGYSNDGSTQNYCTIKYKCTNKTYPSVSIERPKKGYLYIADREIIPTIFGNTIILGKITVEAKASDETGIDRVEFYVDGVLKSTDNEPSYEWRWDETIFFKHTLKVKAYNVDGNTATDEMEAMIFNVQ